MDPDEGSRVVARIRKSVVLPDPLGPTRPNTPFSSVKLTWRRALFVL